MKKLLTVLFVLTALSLSSQVVSESFDASDAGWTSTSGSGTTYWEWGTPSGTAINEDNSGIGSAWATGIAGTFNLSNSPEIAYITSAVYDLSSLSTEGSISVAINLDLVASDWAYVQYSTDNGVTWNKLGTSGSGANWYDDGGNEVWTTTANTSGSWVVATQDLPMDALGASSVTFRFVFDSVEGAGVYSGEGFAIDDFEVLSTSTSGGGGGSLPSEDFDFSDGSWVGSSDLSNTYWEWGMPAGTQINDDVSGGGSAWVTGLSGDFTFVSGDIIYLTSQAYDLSSLTTEGSVSLAINFDLGTFNNGGGDEDDLVVMQYSIDGINWSNLGTNGDGINWYNDAINNAWTQNSGGWVTAAHDLPFDALGEASVSFRLVMVSGAPSGTYGSEGFAIDDFQIVSTNVSGGGGSGGGSGVNPDTQILTFALSGEIFPAVINDVASKVEIFIAPGTDVTSLAPTFTMASGATVDITSGTARDFTNPVVYQVTSSDGMTSTDWTVSASVPDLDLSIYPQSGIRGTQVTIYGRGFSSTLAENVITMGGSTVEATSSSANKLTFQVPSEASFGLNEITVSVNGLNSASGYSFNVLASNVSGAFADYKEADFNLNASSYVKSMQVGDIDNDGDLDLAFDNETILNISTLENGVIQSTVNKVSDRNNGADSFDDITFVDVDNDGFLDVVVGGLRLGWYKNNGDGTWGDEIVIDQTSSDYTLQAFDIDGDFDVDILAYDDFEVLSFTNDGGGSFSQNSKTVPSFIGPAIDWDEDGDMDMITIGSSKQNVVIARNDGTGNFSDEVLVTRSTADLSNLQVGDIDNDGDLDIVIGTANTMTSVSTMAYILNNNDGTFQSEVAFITEGIFNTDRIELADLNNDGFLDIARTRSDGSTNSSHVYYSSASLTYDASEVLDSSSAGLDLVLVDVDQDGDMDVLHEASASGGYFPLFIKLLSDADILGFSLTDETGSPTINTTLLTVETEVGAAADITSLSPIIDVSVNANIDPVSGVAQDFTNSVTYSITAEDGTIKNWTVTVEQIPSTPVVASSNIEQTTATLSWSESNAGVNYELELSEMDDFSTLVTGYDPFTINNPSTSTITADLTGLTAGTTYYARVRAQNAIDSYSAYSETLSFITKPNDPVLTDVATTNIGQDTIRLSWGPVAGVVDSYSIEVSLTENFASLPTDYPVQSTTAQFVLGKDGGTFALSTNTTYWIRIAANNTSGASGYSNSISVLTLPETPVVNAIDNANIDQTQATVSWNSVFTTGGSYQIEVSSTDFAVTETLLSGYPLSVSSNSAVIGSDVSTEALNPATNYWVRVRSSNTSGESLNSNVVSFLTKPADPVLMDVAQANIGQTSIDLSWDAVNGADSYSVEVSTSETFASLVDGYPVNATSSQFNIGSDGGTNPLATNSTYWIRIAANNATGTSGYSNSISVLTLPETPVVNAVDNANVGQSQATVSWNSVFTSGGSYAVEVSSTDFASGGTLLTGYPVTVNTTSTVIGSDPNTEALQPATDYWVRVRSSNASGESSNSNVVSFLTIPETPVVNAATDLTRETFTANWNSVAGADGYNLEVLLSDLVTVVFSEATTGTSSSVTGLSAGVTYNYRVQSYNSTGSSQFSNPVEVTTVPPNVTPTALSIDNRFIDENEPVGTFIGNFSTTDTPGDTHSYSLVSGAGDTDNSSFTISGNQLLSNEVFNFELKEVYTIRVQTEDQDGAVFPQSFDIELINVNEAPTDIVLVLGNATGYDPIGTLVAEIEALDEDAGHSENMEFELIAGGDSFTVTNETQTKTLNTGVAFTNEEDLIIPITLRATDPNGATYDESFNITINAFVDTEVPEFVTTVANPSNFIVEDADYDSLALKAIVSDFRIKEVKLITRLLQESEATSKVIPMTLIDGQAYYIDSVGVGDLGIAGIEYYFEATDEAGNSRIWSNGEEYQPSTMVLELPQSGENAPKVESVTKFGRTVDSYQIISIPFVFDNANQSEVRSIFQEYGGSPDNRTWRIVRFDPELGENGELVNMEATDNIKSGEGYFFIAQEEKQITINNAKINTADPFELVLKQGWNLIGNPYNLDIDFDGVIENNGATGIVESLRVLDTENPETWPVSPVLRSLEGGFVFTSQDITLNVSYTDAFLSFGGRVGERAVSEAEWFLPITLEQNGGIRKGGIGMDRNASESFDVYDEPVLPKWFKYLEIAFLHEGEKFSRYNKDVAPLANSREWEFEISSSSDGISVLKWDKESAQVTNLQLLDETTGVIIDMTDQSSYQFQLNGSGKFRILYSTDPNESFKFENVEVLDAYPNPFVNSFKVPIRLPQSDSDYTVSVDLIDLSGKVVLKGIQKQFRAGNYEYELERPTSVNRGLYLYRVTIKGTSESRSYTKRIEIK